MVAFKNVLGTFFIQTASLVAFEAVMFSASVVESAVVSCLEVFQATTPPSSLNTKPDLDLASSSSDWKLDCYIIPVSVHHRGKSRTYL
ncbi:UNVERIFIED_CONTAM: hypothetical protein Sradi_7113600 [Sesamum radiatum]|uniref:Secreted protein n=1 Tax=Sesamum radiatum TaxID=300843 RepID=A0AAW2J0K6_SESRA